ncbi:hypothetical protein OG345_06695 [Streptomyces sp. NBC_01220]|uniref:hypothetical protein n=1 Tax=Streptomyces TaxID=1883 RepID=UPI001C5CF79C|nr:hypothetical protein [Streptomyces poriferorum]MBW5248338.1 hypothetical protein [Streptomyces poriferorum]MBW5255620.1 hypothetical protein [Streptomyces poriferorum]WSQ42695.1 hypothetical protein OG345_06695 [Streptomyces sp. NBC_01220]
MAENGIQYQLMIEALATDPKARLLRVRVDRIRFSSDVVATTDYTLFINGRRVGPDGPGQSVKQGDTWKVSFKTVCSLAPYGNDVPQAATC